MLIIDEPSDNTGWLDNLQPDETSTKVIVDCWGMMNFREGENQMKKKRNSERVMLWYNVHLLYFFMFYPSGSNRQRVEVNPLF